MHTQLEKMMQTTGNSVKYQRTMDKLDRDTSRVFKEIRKVTERGDASYRAMQGMANLAKARKMTHKTPGQINPRKFNLKKIQRLAEPNTFLIIPAGCILCTCCKFLKQTRH